VARKKTHNAWNPFTRLLCFTFLFMSQVIDQRPTDFSPFCSRWNLEAYGNDVHRLEQTKVNDGVMFHSTGVNITHPLKPVLACLLFLKATAFNATLEQPALTPSCWPRTSIAGPSAGRCGSWSMPKFNHQAIFQCAAVNTSRTQQALPLYKGYYLKKKCPPPHLRGWTLFFLHNTQKQAFVNGFFFYSVGIVKSVHARICGLGHFLH
jgi:hypothetical protein